MAIYHFSMKIISRSKGRSSTASSAYRGGLDITDERTGERFDYSHRKGILDHAILTPSRAPDWAKDASSLWNNVEHFENRKNSQVARENIVALPHELTFEQNRDMLHNFVQDAYIKRGMGAQIDIHAPDQKGSNKNIHAHILLTTRQITRNGFKEKKPRNWNEKDQLTQWRKLWEVHVNRALEKAGHSERIDSRSFEDRGITDKEPTTHMGVEATAMERRGEDSRQGEKNKAVEFFNQHISSLKEERKVIDLAIEREERTQRRKETLTQAKQQRRENNRATQKNTALKNKIPTTDTLPKQNTSATPETITFSPSKDSVDRSRYKMEAKQREELYQFEIKASDAVYKEKERLREFYKPKEHIRKYRDAQRKLNKHQGWVSRITGKTKALAQELEDLRRNVDGIKNVRNQTMRLFNSRIAEDRQQLTQRHEREREEFKRQPHQKRGKAQTFEQAVLKKEVANQNREPNLTPKSHKVRNRGRDR